MVDFQKKLDTILKSSIPSGLVDALAGVSKSIGNYKNGSSTN